MMKNASANTVINRYVVFWVGGPFYIIKINLSQFEYGRVQIIFQKRDLRKTVWVRQEVRQSLRILLLKHWYASHGHTNAR